MKFPSSLTPVAHAVAFTVGALIAASASAQTAAPAAAAAEPLSLDRIVVTGTASGGSKMKQSVSISTLEADDIVKQAATSSAEILRTIPGVRSESSGGEGNANITVRGLPVSAGGARYVQFQEDGLPVLLFGDISFGTSDQFVRADYSLDHLEVIRGGSASTLATNAPGGIFNFISKDGSNEGGAVGLTVGAIGGKQTRLDFDYGGKLGAKTRFHIGGYHRVGEGDRETGFNAANGGQLKANLTHELDNGFVRVSFKALDDKTPSFMPVPVYVQNGQIKQIPGIDPRTAFFISSSLSRDPVFTRDGNMATTDARDGLHVKSTALGLEGNFDLGGGWTINDKFRRASNNGRFIALFPANNGDGATPATSSTFTATLFNTSIDKLDNTVNDLKLSKSFGSAQNGGKTTLTAGLFSSVQDVALTWFWNQYTVDMKNHGASATFATAGWDTWGGCCVRSFDVQYTNTAPYAALSWDNGALTLDASVRRDEQKASGWALQDDPVAKTWDAATQQKVDYTLSKTSYSLGANYQISKDLAAFARTSSGVSFNADRILYGNPLDGSVPVAINEVKQTEGGVKWRSGGVNAFLTVFNANTEESNFEATTQKFSANKYKASGAELELGWRAGALRINGGLTLTDAKISASNDASVVGNKPRRVSDLVLQVSPSFSVGDLEFGATVMHNGKSWGDDANTITMPAYTVINGFASYQINERTQALFSVNNLSNAIGYTEIEGDGHAARSINGRSAKVSLKYQF
ncbi:TonB-dependent siderophore receptor [Ideonella sp.]|uniref:TonB-dependent siderophore receptor n=1 Tax=Ideonella sp. TaxID=1929293 RepID=UPI003BB7C868